MCGITGIVTSEHITADLAAEIQRMTNAIRHRGPDGEGFLLEKNGHLVTAYGDDTPEDHRHGTFPHSPAIHIAQSGGAYRLVFGHRRLAIIDLSPAAHQPMCDHTRELWITYNGELYNYIELKEELSAKGYLFFSHSDTEVILAAYREWGTSCLSHFNGMWAFVIYDKKKGELFGARDRAGVKPFYYYKNHSVFLFASEQKALLKSTLVRTGINPAAAFDFFVKEELEYEEESLFKNIFELFPAHAFSFTLATGTLKKWKYYELNVNVASPLFRADEFEQAAAHLKTLIVQAVSLRLRSDVPVGACLSGGIDSSAITGIATTLLTQKKYGTANEGLSVFTASFDNESIDESRWAMLAAKKNNARWHQTKPTADGLLHDLGDLIYSQDIPLLGTSTYAQYCVMQLAKTHGMKVLLDGQGSDELFAGYDIYLINQWMELLSHGALPSFFSSLMAARGPGANLAHFIKQYLRFYGIRKLDAGIQSLVYRTYFPDLTFLNRDFMHTYSHRLSRPAPPAAPLNQVLHYEYYNTRLKNYLRCEDRCSMWHSVESRTPFADDLHLVEYAFHIPGTYKIHRGISKYILREAIKDFIPEAIYRRKDKMGYVTPGHSWVSVIKPDIEDLFNSGISDFFDIDKIKNKYACNLSGNTGNERFFKFISFAKWKQVYGM